MGNYNSKVLTGNEKSQANIILRNELAPMMETPQMRKNAFKMRRETTPEMTPQEKEPIEKENERINAELNRLNDINYNLTDGLRVATNSGDTHELEAAISDLTKFRQNHETDRNPVLGRAGYGVVPTLAVVTATNINVKNNEPGMKPMGLFAAAFGERFTRLYLQYLRRYIWVMGLPEIDAVRKEVSRVTDEIKIHDWNKPFRLVGHPKILNILQQREAFSVAFNDKGELHTAQEPREHQNSIYQALVIPNSSAKISTAVKIGIETLFFHFMRL